MGSKVFLMTFPFSAYSSTSDRACHFFPADDFFHLQLSNIGTITFWPNSADDLQPPSDENIN